MKIFILGILFVVSACSSLSKDECARTNWQKKGHVDGSRGIDPSKIADYKNDCSEHGLTVDNDKYGAGHKQGLIYYCTYKNGLDAGLAGENFTPICKSTEPAFNKGYEEGYRVFKIQELEKKEQARISKAREVEKEEILKDLKNHHGEKECSFNSDCSQDDTCQFDRCQSSGQTCRYNSDCGKTDGQCERYSRYTSFNDLVEINLCRFR